MQETDGQRNGSSSSSVWLVIGVLVLGLFIGRAVLRQSAFRKGMPASELGAALPPLKVEGWLNSSQPVSADQLSGQVVLIDCWATWCPPCRAAMPGLVELKDRFSSQDVVVIGLTTEQVAEISVIEQFVHSVPGLDWPIGYGAQPTFQALGVSVLPTLFVFDRQGNSVWQGHSVKQAESALVKALAGG